MPSGLAKLASERSIAGGLPPLWVSVPLPDEEGGHGTAVGHVVCVAHSLVKAITHFHFVADLTFALFLYWFLQDLKNARVGPQRAMLDYARQEYEHLFGGDAQSRALSMLISLSSPS